MGCFDSTCAVTRTAVHHGDEVLMVCIRDMPHVVFSGQTHSRRKASVYELLIDTRLEGIDGEDLPEWKQKPEEERRHRLNFYGYVMRLGIYNDYGWLEDLEQPETAPDGKRYYEGDNTFKFFIHKSVVDEILGCDSSSLDIINVVRKIAEFAYDCRVELYHSHLLGEQYGGSSEVEANSHSLLIKLMQKAHDFVYDKATNEDDDE